MKIEFNGFLYAGLMIKNNEPYLIEYNVRMGDPECQTILPKLKTDLLEIIIACCNKRLDKIKINFSKKKSICVVLCSNGYPDKYKKNIKIKNIKKITSNSENLNFHAGTILKDNEVLAVGGRVLNFVALSDNFLNAREEIIKNIENLNWKNGFYRKDIGFKVINE